MKNFAPDTKAPRFRKKSLMTVKKAMILDIQSKVFAAKYLTEEQIKNIILEFNSEMCKTVIDKRDGVEIPSQIGHIFIGTCPRSKGKNVNFKKTLELGKSVQYMNWETDSNLAKIFFTTYASRYKFKNNELWGFTASRNFKRSLAKVYPENWKRYVQVDPHKKISTLFRSRLYNIVRNEDAAENLKMYNEFEF
jgi:hypothetical protein